MTGASSGRIAVTPELCDGCGKCRAVCAYGSVVVGQDYVLIDWSTCDNCGKCLAVCESGALKRGEAAPRVRTAVPATPVAPSEVGKVVVGSRAEAKAVRKAAEQAAKQAARSGMRPAGARRAAAGAEPAATGPAVVAAPIHAPAGADDAVPPTVAPAHRRTATGAAEVEAAPARSNVAAFPERSAAHGGLAAWTWVDAVAVLAVLLFTIVAKNAVLALPALALMPKPALAIVRAVVLAAYYGIQLAALVFLAGRHGTGVAEGFGLRRGKDAQAASAGDVVASIGIVIGLFVLVEAIALGYGMTVQALGWQQPLTLSSDVSTVFGGGGLGIALSAVLVALVAPLAEELAFRGVILTAVEERVGRWPAIVISSLLFAAYHVNLWLFFPMLVFGVALGWLTSTRRSLWPAIALHMLYNGLAVAAAFLVK